MVLELCRLCSKLFCCVLCFFADDDSYFKPQCSQSPDFRGFDDLCGDCGRGWFWAWRRFLVGLRGVQCLDALTQAGIRSFGFCGNGFDSCVLCLGPLSGSLERDLELGKPDNPFCLFCQADFFSLRSGQPVQCVNRLNEKPRQAL